MESARSLRMAVSGVLAVGIAVVAAWPSAAPSPAAPSNEVSVVPAASATLNGLAVFQAKGCSGCHLGPGSSSSIELGPSLVNLATAAGTRVDGLDAEDYVRQSVLTPGAFVVPGFDPVMPTLPVSAAELEALTRYLLG